MYEVVKSNSENKNLDVTFLLKATEASTNNESHKEKQTVSIELELRPHPEQTGLKVEQLVR